MKESLFIFLFFVCSHTLSAQKGIDTVFVDSVLRYICEKEIKYPNIVICQAIFETGWMRHTYLMSRNNLFGFRHKVYMTFKNWKESVDYYKMWQDKFYKDDKEDYYKFLVRIRYSTRYYPYHLKKIHFSKTCNN